MLTEECLGRRVVNSIDKERTDNMRLLILPFGLTMSSKTKLLSITSVNNLCKTDLKFPLVNDIISRSCDL